MREKTYAEAIREALFEEMNKDDRIIIMGEDVGLQGGVFGATRGLFEQFGSERVRETPISEGSFVGCAIGAAVTGLKPVVEIMYIDFITLALDQIINQAAKIKYMFGGKAKVPIIVRTQGGGGRGNAGQHSQSLESLFIHIPGLKVIMPSTPYDAKGLLKSSLRDNNPIIFIEHKLLYSLKGDVPEDEYYIPIGKAEVKRKGNDVTIIATSYMLHKVIGLSDKLKKNEGIDIEIIDPRTLNPFDYDMVISSIKKTGKLLIVHEACRTGGIGSEISSRIVEQAFDHLDAPIKIVAGKDSPIPYSKVLEDAVLPSEEDIEKAIKEIIKNKII
ncbi:MAG: alpha-ketoacid dehydrogenase subunit beta [Actinobacteria bacterium]|nr:alpha-ketoacid dehydrogenase subunit beta [Actinomycetota bacterium]